MNNGVNKVESGVSVEVLYGEIDYLKREIHQKDLQIEHLQKSLDAYSEREEI